MFTKLREWGFRKWYWYVNKVDKNAEILFMNYGYAYENDFVVPLERTDEPNRYSIQLYHKLTDSTNLTGKDICEIGCGRGGGLSYLTKLFQPKTAIGVDLDPIAANFCNRHYKYPGLTFLQGDAQKLSLSSDSVDVVINTESSHRYPQMNFFLAEVNRILRKNGYLLITDFRYDYEMTDFDNLIKNCGLELISKELITHQVVKALEKDDSRRRELVNKLAPRFLHKTALNFAGAVGSPTYNQFATQKYIYFIYILQKK